MLSQLPAASCFLGYLNAFNEQARLAPSESIDGIWLFSFSVKICQKSALKAREALEYWDHWVKMWCQKWPSRSFGGHPGFRSHLNCHYSQHAHGYQGKRGGRIQGPRSHSLCRCSPVYRAIALLFNLILRYNLLSVCPRISVYFVSLISA